MENLTFEKLPLAVELLIKEVNELKKILTEEKEQQKKEFQEKFLTINEASEFLNISVPTIYSKVSKNELPVMKRGKRLYFSNIELQEYLKQGRK